MIPVCFANFEVFVDAFQHVSGEETEFEADLVILATGYERPDLAFLEEADLFPEGYEVRSILYRRTYSLVNYKIAAKLVFAKFFDRGLVNLVDQHCICQRHW